MRSGSAMAVSLPLLPALHARHRLADEQLVAPRLVGRRPEGAAAAQLHVVKAAQPIAVGPPT